MTRCSAAGLLLLVLQLSAPLASSLSLGAGGGGGAGVVSPRRSSLLSRTGLAVLRRRERLAGAEAALLATQNTTNASANATPPVYAAALAKLKQVEGAVANLTMRWENLTKLIIADETMVRNVSQNLTKARNMLYAAEWVVRQNKWTLGKNQVALADSNSSLGNEGYKIKMTGPQTGNVQNASTLLATKANLSATPENLTAIENVETALWNSMNPSGKTSMDKFEKRLTESEKTFKEFKGGLDKEVRRVLAGKSKAELDLLRKAIFHLGKVSSGVTKEEDEDEDDEEGGGGDYAGGY